MTLQASLLAAVLAFTPALARADDQKKDDHRTAIDTQKDNPSARADRANPDAPALPTDDMRPGEKLTDDQVLFRLHKDNLEEIKLGTLAQQRGAMQGAKDFGRMLVTDHTDADRQVKAMADKMHVDLEAVKDPGFAKKQPVKQRKADELQKMTGRDFDRAFAMMMSNGHKEAVEMVKTAQTNAQGEMKAFYGKLLPVLQHHLEMANDLLSKTSNTASAK